MNALRIGAHYTSETSPAGAARLLVPSRTIAETTRPVSLEHAALRRSRCSIQSSRSREAWLVVTGMTITVQTTVLNVGSGAVRR